MSRASSRVVIAVAAAAVVAVLALVGVASQPPGSGAPPRLAESGAQAAAAPGRPHARVRAHDEPPSLAVGPPVAAAAPSDEVVATGDGAVFADRYATAICACADTACATAVSDRYDRELGTVRPEPDARKLHAAVARALDCQRALAP